MYLRKGKPYYITQFNLNFTTLKLAIKKKDPRRGLNCVILLISEVVLHTQFTTYAEVIFVFCSQERNLTIDSKGVGDGDTQTCFTRELSLGVYAVSSDDSRACLDVVGSSANFAFLAYVDICRSSGVVITSPTCVGLDVDVGTCKGRCCHEGSSGSKCDCGFDHWFNTSLFLLVE